MARTILLGGGTGFVGTEVTRYLTLKHGFDVIAISRTAANKRVTWKDIEEKGLPPCYGVINVAGENLLNPFRRWNDSYKADVRSSRIDTTKTLANAIIKAKEKPKVFVNMSGVAYYKPDPNIKYTEDSVCEEYDFLSKLTHDWEAAAKLPEDVNVRQVTVRTGVVLGRYGGMIKQISTPFWLGLGGPMGWGNQWFPWIHADDIGGIISHAVVKDDVSGVLNAVTPVPVTNSQFSKAFASAFKRPCIFMTPGFVVKAIFGNDRATVMLEGQKVFPKRTIESGYEFRFPGLARACQELTFYPKKEED